MKTATKPKQRRAWGVVQHAVKDVLASDPTREWQATDVLEQLDEDISLQHTVVVLAYLTRKGELERTGPGLYRVRALGPVGSPNPKAKRTPTSTPGNERYILLRLAADGTVTVIPPVGDNS